MVKKMIFARLQVGELVADEAAAPLVSDNLIDHHRAPFRINGRLSILDDAITHREFDNVQLCLRGVITTSIGHKSVLENIISLTDIKAAADFKSSFRNNQDDTKNGRHVDFFFELPTSMSTTDGLIRPLPLSGVFKGTINLNQNHSLNDHRVIDGECEVLYWVEAKFRRAGTQVGFLHRSIQIRSLYPRLQASFANAAPLCIRAKPDILTRCRLQKVPDLSVTLSESEMTINHDDVETGKRHITLPLTAAINTSDNTPMHSRQSLPCAVEVKWQVNTRISTLGGRKSPDRPQSLETIDKTSTASAQKSNILFRPLPHYDDREVDPIKNRSAGPFVATSQLDVSVPDAVSQPSLDWRHLSRNYTLQLSLHFRGAQGAPNYKLHASFPLSVTACCSKADDAVFDHFAVDCLDTMFDSDEGDDLSEILSPLSIDGNPPQTLSQRAIRTPPPPYFR